MHLVKIDVVSLQALETALHFTHDVHSGRAAPIEIPAHREPDFGGQDDFRPHALQGITQQRLALPEAVDVRGVNAADAPVQSQLHHSRCVLLTEVAHVHLAAELHRAERHLAHDESGIAQFPVLHLPYSLWPLQAGASEGWFGSTLAGRCRVDLESRRLPTYRRSVSWTCHTFPEKQHARPSRTLTSSRFDEGDALVQGRSPARDYPSSGE